MIYKGKAWKYGDNIDTDVIIPGKYLHILDLKEVAKHAMENLDPSFASNVEVGDIVVAGSNFGCGSSREYAPIVLKELGVGAVIALSFARIFFRNAVNVGLPVIECAVAGKISKGDTLLVDVASGTIEVNNTIKLQGTVLPAFMLDIIKEGGLVPYKRARHQK